MHVMLSYRGSGQDLFTMMLQYRRLHHWGSSQVARALLDHILYVCSKVRSVL